MSKVSYEVTTGLDYDNKRAEIGDVVTDLPKSDIKDLLALGAIRAIKNSEG